MLYAPKGTILKLTQDWEFKLKPDYRNKNFKYIMFPFLDKYDYNDHVCILPSGTILKVDLIKLEGVGEGHWNSITFKILECPHVQFKFIKKKMLARFWAVLEDVNKIEFEIMEE